MSKTNILVVEGYLLEFPDTIKTIAMAREEARKCGALVAIAASDVTCIERHYDDFWDIMQVMQTKSLPTVIKPGLFATFHQKKAPYQPLAVNTCGAGDAYASGILYGLSRGGSDLRTIGTLASMVASIVVAQQGTRLGVQDALKLAELFSSITKLQQGGLM